MNSKTETRNAERRRAWWKVFHSSLPHLLTSALLAFIALGGFASSYFPEFYHEWKPEVGCWSTYRITDSDEQEAADLTFAIVGEEKGQHWLELRTTTGGATAVAAFLVKGDPTEDDNVLAVRAQDAGGPAIEISKAALERLKARGDSSFGSSALPIGPRVGKLEGLPDETLKVAGKSLKCRRVKIVAPDGESADVWMNDSVAPFGLVKLVSGPEQVVLTDFGKGAAGTLKGPYMPLEVP